MAADSVLIVGGPGSWILVKVLFEKSYPLEPAKTGVIFPWRVQETSLDNCSKSREILRRTLGPNLTVWAGIERFLIHTWLNITLNPTTLDSVLFHCIPFHSIRTTIRPYIHTSIKLYPSIQCTYACIYLLSVFIHVESGEPHSKVCFSELAAVIGVGVWCDHARCTRLAMLERCESANSNSFFFNSLRSH